MFRNSCKNFKRCWIFSLTSVTSLMKFFRTFGKIRPALVRLLIVQGKKWTIRIRISTRGGNLLFVTFSVPTLLLVQNSIQLVPRNLSLTMKNWNLKLTAYTHTHTHTHTHTSSADAEMRGTQTPLPNAYLRPCFLINLQGLCLNLSVETFVQFSPIGMDFLPIRYK
jgi:hypothetical protein